MKKFNGNPAVILLVEDNAGDARLAAEALKDGKISNDLRHVVDGVEAMQFLRKQGPYKDVPRPDLMLLDLNMPRMDGREVLEEMSKDPMLLNIPVVVLTTSDSDNDIINSYSRNANCYISKPVDYDQFLKVIKSIEHFWFSVVSLPETLPSRF